MKTLLPYWIAFTHRIETEKEFYFLKSLFDFVSVE